MEKGLSETLKDKAIRLGLCDEWTSQWGMPDKQGLIDKYIHGIDFCIKHDYPSIEFIKRNFEKDLLHENNIFVDEDVQSRNLKCVAVLNGGCTGTLLFDGYSTCTVYARHNSNVTIDCSYMSKVFIHVYDRAKVKALQSQCASVYILTHGDECEVNTKGDISVRKAKN